MFSITILSLDKALLYAFSSRNTNFFALFGAFDFLFGICTVQGWENGKSTLIFLLSYDKIDKINNKVKDKERCYVKPSDFLVGLVVICVIAIAVIIIVGRRYEKKRRAEQAKQLQAEQERQRIKAEQEAIENAEKERQRIEQEEQERQRKQREQEVRQAEKEKQRIQREKLKAEQERQKKEEQERQRVEEELRRKAEQERLRIEQEKRIKAEQEKKLKEQQALQEKGKIYHYFMSEPQCKLAIGNFVNQNSKTIEHIILDGRMEELSKEISEAKKHIEKTAKEMDRIEENAVKMEEKRNKEASEKIERMEKSANAADAIRIRSISNEIVRVEGYVEEQSERVAKLTKTFRAAAREEEKMIAQFNSYHSISQNATQHRKKAEEEMKAAKERLKTQKELLKSKKQELTQVQRDSAKAQKAESLKVQKELQSAQKESLKAQNAESLKKQKELLLKQEELLKMQEEYSIMKNRFDVFDESVAMLTNVLIDHTSFKLTLAKQIVHKAIISSLLNEWTAGFKKTNNDFCSEVNTDDKDKSIHLFARKFNKANTPQKTMYSFFLLLNNIKVDLHADISNLRKAYHTFEHKLFDAYDTVKETAVYENFKAAIFTHNDINKDGEGFTLDDIDRMDGTQFEHYVARLFEKMGYDTEVTKHSGDQGIDVIAKNDIVAIGIQAKCYSSTVGNSAVQEAIGGKALYHVDKVMVITNNEFTPAAKQLAKATNVELWDRSKLEEKMRQYAV